MYTYIWSKDTVSKYRKPNINAQLNYCRHYSNFKQSSEQVSLTTVLGEKRCDETQNLDYFPISFLGCSVLLFGEGNDASQTAAEREL